MTLHCAAAVFAASNPSPFSTGGMCKYAGHSVRAVPIRVLTVGKRRSAGVRILVDEYLEKLRHFCPVEDVHVRSNPKNARDKKVQIEEEDSALLSLIRSSDCVVMLDEHGMDIGSEKMAELIADAGNSGASRLMFCIGGPYGHGQKLRERANISIKLSSMVLNHQIALVVLMEQLYSMYGGATKDNEIGLEIEGGVWGKDFA